MNYKCSKCNKIYNTNIKTAVCSCGGLLDLEYDIPDFSRDKIDSSIWNMFRYRNFMPVEDDSWKKVTLGEGMTPIIRLDDSVFLKMDYYMPTLSFKDRGAAMLVSHCKSIGVKKVVQDSSGNAGNSIAAYCARAGIDCEIFVPEGTSSGKIKMIAAHGAKINIIEGNREDCANACRKKVFEEGIYYASHVYNPFFYEGTKTYIYEVFEQLGYIPSNIFIPLGNGTLFFGIIKGLEHLMKSGVINSFPHIVAVQSERCAPIYEAVKQGLTTFAPVNSYPTLAEGIAIAEPMRHAEILALIYKYNIEIISVPESRILPAQKLLSSKGIFCEPTTAATFAGYTEYCDIIGKIDDVLIPVCGAGIKSEH